MTITESTAVPLVEAVTFDLYRDIHKGIRSELFAVVGQAGRTDPADHIACADLAAAVAAAVDLLESHAAHEDGVIQPSLERHLPDVAARVEIDHRAFEGRGESLVALSADVADGTTADPRGAMHSLYLELASFTSSYLSHQDFEERVLMPALEAAVGVPAVMEMHRAILASIPQEEMARSLALMLPAMNLEDRVEMLGGMRATAPSEAFMAVWDLARSVLDPPDHAAVRARFGQ